MKSLSLSSLRRLAATLLVAACCVFATQASAGQYTNFTTAIYIPVGVLLGFQNPEKLASDWERIHTLANGCGYPLLLMVRCGKGVLYAWTMPDNFNDLYRLPPAVTSELKGYFMTSFRVRWEGPSRVAIFAYNNNTFIAQSYRHEPTDVVVKVAGKVAKLRNAVTGELMAAEPSESRRGRNQALSRPTAPSRCVCCRTATAYSPPGQACFQQSGERSLAA